MPKKPKKKAGTGKTTGKVGKGNPPVETRFKKGKSGNEKGRPLGQRNYATIYKAALKKLAESKGMSPEELEDFLHQSGLANAFKDYRFYKDTLDRLHGKPIQPTDVTTGGEKIETGVVCLPMLYERNMDAKQRAANRSPKKN